MDVEAIAACVFLAHRRVLRHLRKNQMSSAAVVLNANILICAVMGQRILELIQARTATFKPFAHDVAYADGKVMRSRGMTYVISSQADGFAS